MFLKTPPTAFSSLLLDSVGALGNRETLKKIQRYTTEYCISTHDGLRRTRRLAAGHGSVHASRYYWGLAIRQFTANVLACNATRMRLRPVCGGALGLLAEKSLFIHLRFLFLFFIIWCLILIVKMPLCASSCRLGLKLHQQLFDLQIWFQFWIVLYFVVLNIWRIWRGGTGRARGVWNIP